jgi:hypothetical protein
MKPYASWISAGLLATLQASAPALAQTVPRENTSHRLQIEGHAGALWPQPPRVVDPADEDRPSTTRAAVGGRLAWYFVGDGALGGRVKLQVTSQYAESGSFDDFDRTLDRLVRTEGHWLVLTPALGIDLVRTSRFTVDAHAGPTLVGEMTTFLLERSHRSDDEDDFKNVCDLSDFEHRCSDRYRGVAALGVGARTLLRRGSSWYLGVDYTWLSHDRHVFVATIGWRMR